MAVHHTEFGRIVNRNRYDVFATMVGMARNPLQSKDSKSILWENVQAIMRKHYGKENLTRLGADTGIKNGGATRIKARASVGLDIIDRVAACYGLHSWQLFVPNLDPDKPPEILSASKLRLYASIERAVKEETRQ